MTTVIYACNSKDQAEMIFSRNKANLLMSYFYLKQKRTLVDLLEFIQQKRITIDPESIFMLDSGAYSAWRSGKEIILWEFIDFIKEYHSFFTHIVCLDVIDNPVMSEANHLIMLEELKDYNLEIIPVFHAGEPFSVLDYMVEKGYSYLGISPNNNWYEHQKRDWLEKVYSRYDFQALGIKTHAFGYQSMDGVLMFPFSSADAATWNLASGYGRVMDPVIPSVRYSDRGKGESDHIDQVAGGDSEFTLALCEELGLTTDDLRTDYLARRLFNIEATERAIKIGQPKYKRSVHVDLLDDEGYQEEFSIELVMQAFEEEMKKKTGYETEKLKNDAPGGRKDWVGRTPRRRPSFTNDKLVIMKDIIEYYFLHHPDKELDKAYADLYMLICDNIEKIETPLTETVNHFPLLDD